MTAARYARYVAVAVALAGLLAAGVWSVQMGWADYQMRQGTIGGIEAAIAIAPDQAEYHVRLAWLVSDGDPQRARNALHRAVALNPSDAQSWIELGLRAEAEGDLTIAQQNLLRAAEADARFLPRWTLANYFFRRGDAAHFWFWAKEAAAMLYGDGQPLFRLCGRLEEDGNLINRLELRRPDVRAAYLSYLLGQDRLDLIEPAVHHIFEENREADARLLSTACDRLLDAGRVNEAAELWNRQVGTPLRTPAGEGDQLVANASFAAPPTSRGFDWRLPVVEGIGFSRAEESRGLRITFSGRQPEDCEVLVQLVPLGKKLRYELTFVYRTRGIAGGDGLGWRVTDASGGAVLGEGPSLASDADSAGQLSFESPAGCRLARLALRYRRAPGTTRIEGFLILRGVALRPAAQLPIDGSRVRK